jgi:hypothetical protein
MENQLHSVEHERRTRLMSRILLAVAVLLSAMVAAGPATLSTSKAQVPTITCSMGSFGSGSGFSSVTLCSGPMAFLSVNSNLFTPQGSADDFANGACLPIVACGYASAFKSRTISPAGGPWLVTGTHSNYAPPGYSPPASIHFTSYLIWL